MSSKTRRRKRQLKRWRELHSYFGRSVREADKRNLSKMGEMFVLHQKLNW